jgi:tripartite-type tricarboxylate transporter receptor subunit TctC
MSGIRGIAHRLAIGLALSLASLAASAQYPDKPVKIVVPFAAGGFTDTLARIVGQELNKKWGQPVVIENKPGAGGNIAAEQVAHSPADGYTLFVATITTHGINPTLYKVMKFDAVKDFDPVVLLAATPNVLIVGPNVPVASVKDLIAKVKADPKKFSYASTGVGSSVHLQGEQFKAAVGIEMAHVPYKGSSQALSDMVGGSVQVMFDNFLFQLPQITAGRVKALAITSRQRSPQIPDVPTMTESGISGFEYGPWFGLVAPAGTPAAAIKRINEDVNQILQRQDIQEKLRGAELIGGTSREFVSFIDVEMAKWGKVVRDLDLTVE